MKFNIGEFVLVSNGEGAYKVKQVTNIRDGMYLLADGYFGYDYKEKDIHKCPKTIKKIFIEEVTK